MLAFFLAHWLEQVPMACIGGILLFVAFNMVKPTEVREVVKEGRFATGLMVYTAVMVAVTDFMVGVMSALVIWGIVSLGVRARARAQAGAAAESLANE
jgi:MFS superfamily sulfate permease-like transporter